MSRSDVFPETVEVWQQLKVGLPLAYELDDDLRFAVTLFDQLIEAARADFTKSQSPKTEAPNG